MMAEKTEITKTKNFGFDIDEMTKAGVCFGHRTSRTNPKMKPYISGTKNNVHIIDAEKTAQKLAEAIDFIRKIVSEGKVLLVVGTKIQMKDLTDEFAISLGFPYIKERWLGGTFTNFETLKKRIDYFKDLKKKKETGELEKYTKKERMHIDKELEAMKKKFDGIKDLTKLPDAIFVLDLRKDLLAVKEAKKKNIAIIGIADTNTDPTLLDYFIPANDDAIPSVKYILNEIKKAIWKISNKSSN